MTQSNNSVAVGTQNNDSGVATGTQNIGGEKVAYDIKQILGDPNSYRGWDDFRSNAFVVRKIAEMKGAGLSEFEVGHYRDELENCLNAYREAVVGSKYALYKPEEAAVKVAHAIIDINAEIQKKTVEVIY